MKERIKSVGFWTGLLGAVFLILGAFGVEIGDETASAVINAVCSLLVFAGIIVPSKLESDGSSDNDGDENADEADVDIDDGRETKE